MNRRALMGAAAVSIVPMVTAAKGGGQSDILRRLIEEVIDKGDMSNLDQMVRGDVVIATLGVNDIAGFRKASEEGFAARSERYALANFDIKSIAENAEWTHALVQFTGEQENGRKERQDVFYVAQFRNNLISQLYLS